MIKHTRYELNKEGIKKHRNMIFIIIGILILGSVILAALALPRWKEGTYVLINFILLGCGVALYVANKTFDGTIPNAGKNGKKRYLITAGVIAAAIWLVLSITGIGHIFGVFIFIFDIVMVYCIFQELKDVFKNIWDALQYDNIKAHDRGINAAVMLDGIHPDESMVTPLGRVYISKHSVMYTCVNHIDGHVFVEANGEISIREKKLFSNDFKDSSLDDSMMLLYAEEGAEKIKKIVEEGCKKRNIPVPQMAYTHAIFLPNFDRSKYMYTQDAYSNIRWDHKVGSFKKYKGVVSKADYFRGKACFMLEDLNAILNCYDNQFAADNVGTTTNDEEINVIAEIIAEACDLTPALDEDMYQKTLTSYAKKIEEEKNKNL